jgi:hypothetical protein
VLKKTYESVSGAVTNAPNNFVSGLQGVTNMVASGASSATSGLDALKTPA